MRLCLRSRRGPYLPLHLDFLGPKNYIWDTGQGRHWGNILRPWVPASLFYLPNRSLHRLASLALCSWKAARIGCSWQCWVWFKVSFILILQITMRPLFCLYNSGSHLSQEGVNLLGQPIPSLSVGPQRIKYKNGECFKLKKIILVLKALIQDQLFLLVLIMSEYLKSRCIDFSSNMLWRPSLLKL